MRTLSLASGIGLLLVSSVYAQETNHFAFNVGAGFTEPIGRSGQRLDPGWNASVGVGYNFTPYIGLMGQFNDTQSDINTATLNNLGFPGGNVNVWSVTLDPVIHTNPRGPVDVYFIGGAGLYHWRQEFTAPTVAIFNGFDPFFGFFQTAVPANQVLTSDSTNKPGVNGGIGVSFGTKWHAKFYAEARYHRIIFGSNNHADMLPVTFGVRW